jgi:FkbM family methyltransferase
MVNGDIKKIAKFLINKFITIIPMKKQIKKHYISILISKYRELTYSNYLNKLGAPSQNKMLVGKYELNYPAGHSYKSVLSNEPLREFYLGILSKHIFCKNSLEYIDLGANIGDSYAIVKTYAPRDFKAILVEPSQYFLPYLKSNILKYFSNILVIEKFAGTSYPLTDINAELFHWGGTAELRRSENIIGTYDQIAVGELINHNTALIKIDCDGSDLDILNTLKQNLLENKPIIFFEAVVDKSGTFEFFCETVTSLEELGYKYATVCHCSGLLMYSGAINESFFDIIRLQLNLYLNKEGGSFYYTDIAIFTEDDAGIHVKSSLDLREQGIKLFEKKTL